MKLEEVTVEKTKQRLEEQKNETKIEGEYKTFGKIVQDLGGDQMALVGTRNYLDSCLALHRAGKLVPGHNKPWIHQNPMSQLVELWHVKESASSSMGTTWQAQTLYKEGNKPQQTVSPPTPAAKEEPAKKVDPPAPTVTAPEAATEAATATATVPKKRGRKAKQKGKKRTRRLIRHKAIQVRKRGQLALTTNRVAMGRRPTTRRI